MIQELLYTSAPQGLKPGSRGFCTVLCTQGMAAPVVEALEGLSGYKQIYMPGDPDVDRNPVGWSHLMCTIAGRRVSVLSRIANYGVDYTQRTNKLAHHVLLDAGDRIPAGPARLLSHPGFMLTRFEGEPRLIPPGRKAPALDAAPAPCRAWEAATGDAGWGGVLAESFLKDPSRLVYLTFTPGFDVLPLIAESIALIPPERRWEVTFSTYFTTLPGSAVCQWRCVVAGSQEANESRRHVQALRIALGEPLPAPAESPWVEFARTGVKPDTGRSQHSPAPESSDSRAAAASALDRGETYRLTKPAAPPPPAPTTRSLGAPVPPTASRRKRVWPVLLSLLVVTLLVGTAAVVLVMKGGPSDGTAPPAVASADAEPATAPPNTAPPAAKATPPENRPRTFSGDAAEPKAGTPAGGPQVSPIEAPAAPSDSPGTPRTPEAQPASGDALRGVRMDEAGASPPDEAPPASPLADNTAAPSAATAINEPIVGLARRVVISDPLATGGVAPENVGFPRVKIHGTPSLSVWAPSEFSAFVILSIEPLPLADASSEPKFSLLAQDKSAGTGNAKIATVTLVREMSDEPGVGLRIEWDPTYSQAHRDALRWCAIGVEQEGSPLLLAVLREPGDRKLRENGKVTAWSLPPPLRQAPYADSSVLIGVKAVAIRSGGEILECTLSRRELRHAAKGAEANVTGNVDLSVIPDFPLGESVDEVHQVTLGFDQPHRAFIEVTRLALQEELQRELARKFKKDIEEYLGEFLSPGVVSDGFCAGIVSDTFRTPKTVSVEGMKAAVRGTKRKGAEEVALQLDEFIAGLERQARDFREARSDWDESTVCEFVVQYELCDSATGRVGVLDLIRFENGKDQPLQFRLLDEGGEAK